MFGQPRKSVVKVLLAYDNAIYQKPFDMDQVLLAIRRAGERRAAGKALAESQARYHAFLDAHSDIAFLKDDQFRYIVCNRANARLIGRPIKEIIGQDDFELLDADLARQCRDSDQRALAENRAITTIEVADGRLYETCKFPVPLQNGRVGVGGYPRDVTERQQLFEETRCHAARSAALLETSLTLTSLDLDATLDTIAARARELFAADGCRIFLLEPEGRTPRCALALDESPTAFADLKVPLGVGVTGAVAASGQAEIVNDMLGDPRATQVPGTEVEPEAIMFALLKEHERMLGVISIRRRGTARPFQSADLDLLQAFAALVSAAVHRAHLFKSERQQRQLSDALRDALAAGAPILVNDEVIAFFSLDSRDAYFFASEHLALMRAFAGQASLALQILT